MKPKMTKAEKALDKLIEASYYKYGDGVVINIFSIPKIFAEAKAAVAAGESLDDAMPKIVTKYALAKES